MFSAINLRLWSEANRTRRDAVAAKAVEEQGIGE